MDDIWEINKLLLFIVFVIPGFISIRIHDLFIPTEQRESSKLIIEAIGFSCINYALLSWSIYFISKYDVSKQYPFLFAFFLIGILFIFPVIWPIIYIKIRKSKFVTNIVPHPIPKPWDYIFGKREAFWLVIYLTDGTRVGGRYDTDSFTSSFPEDEQIYIQEVWNIDDNNKFLTKRTRSRGMLISSKDIKAIEFIGG